MNKHTKGPWKFIPWMGRFKVITDDGHGDMIAKMPDNTYEPVTALRNEANARLIAAAPDMLEALLLVSLGFASHECKCEICVDILDVIAKATDDEVLEVTA